MSKGQSLQDPFLNTLRKEKVPVSIFLVNGIKLQGQIESFDQFVVLLKNTVSQMVYKHAISTVVPAKNVLGRIGEEKDCATIRSRLSDTGDPLDRAFLQHALAALGDPEARQAVLRNLDSKDAAIRTYAAVFAGESRIFAAVPLLVRQLDDESLDARVRAAQALVVLAP